MSCLHCAMRAESRGLCRRHYDPLRNRVAAGETSWAALIAVGQARGRLQPCERRSPWRLDQYRGLPPRSL